MIKRSSLPDEITLKTGETLKPVIGGHLDGKPFLTQVDPTRNGWANHLSEGQEKRLIIEEAKSRKLKYREVSVIAKGLRGKKGLDGLSYPASTFMFVEVRTTTEFQIKIAKRVLVAKLELWDATRGLEKELGFDVDSNGDELNDICAALDNPEDVTDKDAELYLAELAKE